MGLSETVTKDNNGLKGEDQDRSLPCYPYEIGETLKGSSPVSFFMVEYLITGVLGGSHHNILHD